MFEFERERSSVSQMRVLCSAAWLAKGVSVAAELGIADLVAHTPRTVSELAEVTGMHTDSLGRLMRALTGFGVFNREQNGAYSLTPLGSTLRSDSDDTMREYIITMGKPWYWAACGDMRESIRTGETTWARRGQSVFRWLAEQPQDGPQFARAMSHLNAAVHAAVAESYDCSRIETLVDVGGAYGSLLREFLTRYPHLRGILLDLPQIAEGATEALNAAGLGHRVECIAGDFFEVVPEGGDLYMLSLILHDWDDDNAERVLRSCRAAMKPSARLLISEIVLPTHTVAHSGFVMDLKMLVHTSGRERTLEEYQALLERTGFKIVTCKHTVADSSIIEAMPV